MASLFPNPFGGESPDPLGAIRDKFKSTWQDVFSRWGIPNLLEDERTKGHIEDMLKGSREGYGPGYVYRQTQAATRPIAEAGGFARRGAMHKFQTGLGSALSSGAAGRLESGLRADTAGKIGQSVLGISEVNEKARLQARGSILNFLTQQQGTIADVMGTQKGLAVQKQISASQLEAQEGVCALVAARFGSESPEEYMMKAWEKMHIRMNRGTRVRRQLWRKLFLGYHLAAPNVVKRTVNGSLRKIREWVTDRFVAYVYKDIYRSRRTFNERVAAHVVMVMSILGWGSRRWLTATE